MAASGMTPRTDTTGMASVPAAASAAVAGDFEGGLSDPPPQLAPPPSPAQQASALLHRPRRGYRSVTLIDDECRVGLLVAITMSWLTRHHHRPRLWASSFQNGCLASPRLERPCRGRELHRHPRASTATRWCSVALATTKISGASGSSASGMTPGYLRPTSTLSVKPFYVDCIPSCRSP